MTVNWAHSRLRQGLSMRCMMAGGLIFSLLAAVVAARVPLPRDEPKEQQEAIEAILRLGGEVMFDFQRPNPNKPNVFDPMAKPKNGRRFHRVVRVSLRDSKATDDDIKILAHLPFLENLDLQS